MLRALRTFLRLGSPGEQPPAPGPAALVQVYLRAGRHYVEVLDRTRLAEAGYWITTGDVAVLAHDVTDAELGEAVLQAIGRSRVEVAVPPRGAKLEAGLFRAMGVRSRRAAMEGTLACLVGREPARPTAAGAAGAAATEAHLRIESLLNGGTRGDGRGYRGLSEPQVVELPDGSAAAVVGQAVRTSLRHAGVG